jgi:hypothetical protein
MTNRPIAPAPPVTLPADPGPRVADTPAPEQPLADERRGAGDDRRTGLDRRSGRDRRAADEPTSSLDRRRGPGRRRTDSRKAAEEGHMSEEQLDFLKTVDEYKRLNARPYPTMTEILEIIQYLGYRKVAPVGEFSLTKPRQNHSRDNDDDSDE